MSGIHPAGTGHGLFPRRTAPEAPNSPFPIPDSRSAESRPEILKVARNLEGIFVEQLFKAMRATVPGDGLVERSSGEEIFSGLLDQHIAAETPDHWQSALGRALYRQLSAAAEGQGSGAPQPSAASGDDRS